jgi:hypothetical protein
MIFPVLVGRGRLKDPLRGCDVGNKTFHWR